MTAGDMLRQAREAHGLHVAVVAAALKVPTQKLEALENDDIDALPDPVFARALAASVCRALKIDPAPVLAKLPGALRPGLADADRTISTHIRSGAPHQGRSSGGSLPSRTLMAVVILLLVGAAALFWLPQSVFDQLSGTVSRWMARSESPAASTESANTASPAPAGTVVESVTPPAPAVEPMPPAAAPIAAAPAPAAPAPTAATPGGNVLVFTARADSWITVTEPGGKQVLRRTVQAGETVGVAGTLPLAVVVGRASGIDVQVRGKPFDLAPLAKAGGVARFEVKP
ncbi:helix-turn-helix domain-containing protein [Variovorax fucosicus]|uniref:helix-turn-helix domain-containing protein n=1 Tax=Variovorax fucosicus TaxID=3053517 RepID=UPI0025776BE7|nr:helix-turn-helix domain-containing protein [Variovorax sp. J22G47]MDM0057034.1 helix-turn-helix domain-containing protein [Variovorax sp. J22G47]